MLKRLDQLAALLLLGVGVLHIIVGGEVFADPTPRRVWFAAAGLLGVTAGLVSLARAATPAPSRLLCLAALSGSGGVLLLGVLLLAAGELPWDSPGAIMLLAAAVSTAFALAGAVRAFSATDRTAR